MGQFYLLVNIDKKKRVCLGPIGGFFGGGTAGWLCHPDKRQSWAGDRLIQLGNYVADIPAGIEEESNYEDMFAMFTHESESDDEGGPPCLNECYYEETSVLRNLCTREYIRADLFPDRDPSHPGLSDVIVPKILWRGLDRGSTRDLDERGPWAGGRFDIVHVHDVKDDPEWKDVTEIEFFNFYTLSAKQEYWVPEADCTCRLCHKYREEHEDFYKNRNKQNQPHQPDGAREMAVEHANPESGNAIHAFYPSSLCSLSAIEILPAELQEEILDYISIGDWVAYAAASKTLSIQATKRLYTSVKLKSADQTRILLEAISRRPELTNYIKDLRLVTMAHWKSLQIAHEILKRLPALKSLDIAPCWFSYGNLPYWEYPFTLRALKWGLKKDSAFEQFRQSQAAAQTLLQEPVIAGFYF